ncbi:MAG: DNA repair exonuclease [Thermoplasmatales archaeon]|nr:DNA repair exonuclease [Thermoplasmatales archaeon]
MGESFRFLHCADLHLGAGFTGLSSVDAELGARMVGSTFAALGNLVSAAVRENVDFVVISGDVFDGEAETPLTRSRFADALAEIGVPCYVAYGNHDYRRRWESSIPLPPNAHVFGPKPHHFSFERDGVEIARIYGVSHSAKAVSKNLAEGIRGERGVYCIGAVHCDLDGPKGGLYSPCPSASLVGKDIDYWALGHIHKRAVTSKDPYVVYPGNTQGLSPKETGERGAYVVTVRGGRTVALSFVRTSDILWLDADWDISDHDDLTGFVDSNAKGLEPGSLVNVRLRGSGPLDPLLRLDPEGFVELFEARTGCRCSGLSLGTYPEVDIGARRKSGDFISAVLDYADTLSRSGRQDILDAICSTAASQSVRHLFEGMGDGELADLVDAAALLVLDKSAGAGR